MKSEKNNLFSGDFPGKEVLRKYIDRTASRSEQRQVELWEQSHPEATLIMEALRNESLSLDSTPNFSSSKGSRGWLFIGVGSFLVVMTVLFWLFQGNDEINRNYSKKVANSIPAFEIQQEKFIIPESLPEQEAGEVTSVEVGDEIESPEPQKEPVALDYIQPISDIERLKEHEEGKLKLATLYPYFYAHNYKIRDYSERSKQWDMQQENLRRIEDPLRSQVLQDYYEKAPYYKELERAMKYFRKGEYTKSYPLFSGILRQFPDDENALFYGGLSAYKLTRFGKASKLFSKTLSQRGGVFYEEALWYLALTLEATGNTRSDSLFCVIQQYDSFYADNAEEKIGHCE